MRPIIGITAWRRELPTFVSERTLLYTLADEYARCVADAGAVPLLLPHLDADEDAERVLDRLDGLLVSGGGDLDPASYGQAPAGSKEYDGRADASELRLLAAAQARRLPTLAVCRGMQLINVAHGGTMIQDLGDDPLHPVSDVPAEVLAARHDVEIAPDSRLAEVVGGGRRTVNTIHHQAIETLGEGLTATAWADDGIIEALQTEDGWPLLAVQWHPEKMPEHDAPLFDWLVAACVQQTSATTG